MFSCEYNEIFKTPILKIICEQLLLKVKLNLYKVCKSSTVSESASFSNTAQTRLLLCKFPEESQFCLTTFEINLIIFLFFYHDLWVFVFLDHRLSALILGPRPSAPRPSIPISLALGPKNIARLNTILLFDFEAVITLKL